MKKLNISTKKYPNTYTLVDDEDYKYLNQRKWYKEHDDYVRCEITINKKPKKLLLHRVIMKPSDGMQIDHINNNKLDNRKCNLRICTHKQNMKTKKPYKNNKLGLKGIVKKIIKTKYGTYAYLYVQSGGKYIGCFKDLKKAIIAYNDFVKKQHGEFAYLNPIE